MRKDKIFEIANTSIQQKIKNNVDWEPNLDLEYFQDFREQQGAFTTLYTGTPRNKKLRGCIGVPHPIYPLGRAIAQSSRSAATSDPRFHPLNLKEFENILMSVEILSPIVEIVYKTREDLENEINIGHDGLLLQYGRSSGLLLPKVPVEYKWDLDEYLKHICEKAMIPTSLLYNKETNLSKFSSELYISWDEI